MVVSVQSEMVLASAGAESAIISCTSPARLGGVARTAARDADGR